MLHRQTVGLTHWADVTQTDSRTDTLG
jgi:hypothetical protein